MNILALVLLSFIIMVGIWFGSPSEVEIEANRKVGENCYGCLLNITFSTLGLGTILVVAVYLSIKTYWWAFLLYLPAYLLAGVIKSMVCKIIPFHKLNHPIYGPIVTQVVAKKQFGVFLIFIGYIIYFILK